VGHVKNWDAFISHASEDKDVVLELSGALRAAGLLIWIDQQELRLGDSLSEKIDEGLAASRFGIVVLSPSFIAKRWPRQELNGLMAREESGRKVILPVWHEINKETLAAYSPMLADRLASNTDRGVKGVAADIVQVIIDPSSGSPAVEAPTLARRFISFLETAPDPRVVREFLAAHSDIAVRAVGGYQYGTEVCSAVRMSNFELDLCVRWFEASTQSPKWVVVQLDRPSNALFEGGSTPIDSVAQRVTEFDAFRRWTSRNPLEANELLPGLGRTFRGIVVAGRRSSLAPGDAERLRRYNEELLGITLHTYDWLVEAAISLS
jgi:TIR domain